ncbi:hypothetical protein N9N67_10375 [Bacteriovoracaceae bacterium]|nr:hypothetical protein [Bacteriovoracaceae bacterium]
MLYLVLTTIVLFFLYFFTERKIIISTGCLIISCTLAIQLYLSDLPLEARSLGALLLVILGSVLYFKLSLLPNKIDFLFSSTRSSKYKYCEGNIDILSSYLNYQLKNYGIKLCKSQLQIIIPKQKNINYPITIGIIPSHIYVQFLHESIFFDFDEQYPTETFTQSLDFLKLLLNKYIEVEVTLMGNKLFQKKVFLVKRNKTYNSQPASRKLLNQKTFLKTNLILNSFRKRKTLSYYNTAITSVPDLKLSKDIL